jgi:PBSX family phage terminase large subunit
MEIFNFPYQNTYEALICDGAIRTGKTMCMALAFIQFAFAYFDRQNFGICGKTVQSCERNVIKPLMSLAFVRMHYNCRYNRHSNLLTISRGNKENYFYVYGGKDNASYTLIQGITLAGVLLDEVALMPQSFVSQATSRCSVPGSKIFFNCNPENPQHWFHKEWICNLATHKA